MHRIGGRLGSQDSGLGGATVGIPLFCCRSSNRGASSASGTVSGGQFDWGGRLLKGNGGAQRYPQNGWKPFGERKGRRMPDCEIDKSSREETRT